LPKNKSSITIGLPIFNGQQFIKSRLQNILSQTFQDFELIISDNASTDSTSRICNEFVQKDNRIKYFRQAENIGGIKNYQFVLDKANTKYFVFATDDDIWDKEFLGKNFMILENDEKIVGSIGKIQWYGNDLHDEFKQKEEDGKFKKIYKHLRKKFQHYGVDSIQESTFEKRAAIFLRKLKTQNPSYAMYSVFRTTPLKKSIVPKDFIDEFYHAFWNNVCISVLEYGGIHLLDEVLIYYNTEGGGTGVTPITQYKKNQITLLQCIVPWSGQISWFVHKFGFKFFVRYFKDFFYLFIMGEITFFLSLFKELKK
jgi:glycosyltransferase involved in cell wall biosynthesis